MRVALVSLDQCWEDKNANQQQCSLISQQIKDDFVGIDLIVYPEMTLTGFSVSNPSLVEPIAHSPSLEFFKLLASQTQCSHLMGYAVNDDENNQFNRCSVVGSEGGVLGSYDKIHTFSFAGESELYARGDSPCTVELRDAQIGLSICFDLRFAELFAYYRSSCDLVINIANWPASRKEHWFTLLRARAIENQYFMVGVNRIGCDGNGMDYQASSVIYDPLGNLCIPIYEEDGFAVYDLDLRQVAEVRERFPFINDRRKELYNNFG